MRKETILDTSWLEARTVEEPNGCWRWIRSIMNNGYGQASVNGSHVTSHRAAYFIKHGEWPNVARHTCDNRWCANPDHIVNGTCADNARDFAERSNAHRGEDHEAAKLSDSDVIIIKQAVGAGVSQRNVAMAFGVSSSNISLIVRGKRRRTR